MNNLYSIVSEQFPEFVRNQYPVFLEFVKAYYKWYEETYPTNYNEIIDIDKTPEYFVQYFKRSLDVDGLLDGLFDNRYLKHIKQIYNSKGSEQALVRILEILYQAEAKIDYPGQYVLRSSDGRWAQQSFITVETVYGSIPEGASLFYIDTIAVVITNIVDISDNKYRLFFKKRTDLDFLAVDQYIRIRDNDNVVSYIGQVKLSPSIVEISDGGANWQLGQLFVIPGSITNSLGKVTEVSSAGAVLSATVYEFGLGHTEDQIIETYPNKLNLETDKLTATYKFDVITTYEGNWKEDYGKISNDSIRLQDNYYYQQFSYVVDSNINSAQYIDIAKALNPAGLKLFTNYNIQGVVAAEFSGYTIFPFKYLFFGPEYVNLDDTVLAKTVIKQITDEIETTDTLSFIVVKSFIDSIDFSSHTDVNYFDSDGYAEEYFAENYNTPVFVLTINTSTH